jgi:hypothetical protein
VELPPVVRKALLALLTGAVAFVVTNLSNQPAFASLVLSLLVGGIVLLVQFLHDLERRQSALEAAIGSLRSESAAAPERTRELLRSEARNISEATRLHQRLEGTPHGLDLLTRLAEGLDGSGLAMKVARAEITSAVNFVDAVARGGEIVAEGDERDWLLNLTRNTLRTLDAISRASHGAGDTMSDEGYWDTEIGTQYLELQRDAVRRGVAIRRIFVVPDERLAEHPDLLALARQHRAAGITVRILNAARRRAAATSRTWCSSTSR